MEPIKKLIPPVLANLKKQDSLKSQSQEAKITDEQAWDFVKARGFGRIYLWVDPDKIYPKKEVLAKAGQIIKNGILQSTGALICGSLGTGKTSILSYLAFNITKEISTINEDPKDMFIKPWKTPDMEFIPTGELFDLFFEKEKERVLELRDRKMLFLDDFGREYQTDFPLSKFENFIEYRYANLLLTFITTNISPVDLAENPKWSRIVDRFRDKKWMDIIEIKGKSMRG